MAITAPHIPPKPLIIGFGAAFILLILIGGIALMRGAATPPPANTPTAVPTGPAHSFDPQTTTTPIPTVTPRPVIRAKLYIYTIDNAGTRKVGDLTVQHQESFGPDLRMDDNGAIYYLESGNVYAYSLATQEKQLLYTNTDASATVTDAVMSRTGKLYVTYRQKSDDGSDLYTVVEDSLSTGKTRTMGPVTPTIYGGVRYLFNTDYGDILLTVGGDGCATHGSVIKLKDERKDIAQIGEGCTDNSALTGFNPDLYSLYLAKPKADSYPDVEYISFDSLNVVSEQISQEYDLMALGNPVRQVLMEGQTAAFLTDTYAVLFDIEKKTAGPKISIPKVTDYGWVLSGTTLYGTSHTEGPNIAVDMTTGAVRDIVLTGVKSKDYSFKYMGTWKKRPIFYVDATE